MLNFIKFSPVGVVLFHEDGQIDVRTDRQDCLCFFVILHTCLNNFSRIFLISLYWVWANMATFLRLSLRNTNVIVNGRTEVGIYW